MGEKKWVRRENYISIQGWMLTDLDLKGNELIIYACIYGFSQAENQVFNGSLQYLADWTNSTKQGVTKCLKSLVEKGFIIKEDKYINGVKFCEYCATKLDTVMNLISGGVQQSLLPTQQSLTGDMQQSLPNNIAPNIPNNNQDNKKEVKKESKTGSFDAILAEYTNDAETLRLLKEWLKVRKAKRAAMTDGAIQMNIEKLDSLANASGMSVNEFLSEIICRGWAAFYEIKQFNNSPKAPAKKANTGGNIFLEIAQEEGIY